MLDVSEDVALRGPCGQLGFDLLQVSRPVVAPTQPVAAVWGRDHIGCLELVALGHAQRGSVLPEQVEGLVCEPRCMAEFKSDAQLGRALRRSFFEEGRKPGVVGFKIRRQLKENRKSGPVCANHPSMVDTDGRWRKV